jgi:uncharacterized protein DUF5990
MTEHEIAMRIVVVDPPSDVTFALQRGRAEIVSATRSTGAPLAFTFSVRARTGGPRPGVTVLGPFAQGTPDKRFVYVNSGTFAGDAASCWSRRAKVSLAGITADLVRTVAAQPDVCLEATIPGRAGDGGPSCATVPLLRGWEIGRLHD